MRNRIAASVCLFGMIVMGAGIAEAGESPRTRREFVSAINQLKVGTSKAAVAALLGKPDDIRTREDRGGISRKGTREIWRYGTSGHLTTATLGQIWIDDVHRVQAIYGQGTPPPDGLVSEPKLRVLLSALGQVPSYYAGSRFNPRRLIRAVNLLQPLGKERALAVIEEYLRVAPHLFVEEAGREGVFLVLRTLFEIPRVPTKFPLGTTARPGYMPPIFVGAPAPVLEPADKTILPRFPIVIEGEIPFLLVTGYMLAGAPQDPESHVAYFRRYGTIRAEPLNPTPKPFAAIEALAKSPRWIFGDKNNRHYDDASGRRMLANQALRLLDTVYRVEPDIDGDLIPSREPEEQQRRLVEVSRLSIRWDAVNGRYTFFDGTFLKPLDLNLYRRNLWEPKVPLLKVELIIERESRRFASIDVKQTHEAGLPHPTGVMRLLRIKTPDKPLVEIQLTPEWDSIHTTIRLDEDNDVQAELTVGKESQRSPVFKP